MTKQIKVKTKTGDYIWIISPDAYVRPLFNKLSSLDIFYVFAQILVKVETNKKYTPTEEKQIIDHRTKILIELNNKVVQLKFFSEEIKKHEKKLFNNKKNLKKIYNYKPHQILIGLIEAFLNTVHSIHYWLKEIDKALGKNFSEEIWKEDWFKLDVDIRNLFQHIESPLLIIEDNKIYLVFHQIDKLQRPKFFNETQNKNLDQGGNYRVLVEAHDIGDDMIKFLNNWAKKYLELINDEETTDIITGFFKDGRFKSKKISLKEIKNKIIMLL